MDHTPNTWTGETEKLFTNKVDHIKSFTARCQGGLLIAETELKGHIINLEETDTVLNVHNVSGPACS